MIEVERRGVISKEKYDELNNGLFKDRPMEHQHTVYFEAENDLRIMLINGNACRLWLKTGKLHDNQRKEIEIMSRGSNFLKYIEIFKLLGMPIKCEFDRRRMKIDDYYNSDEFTYCLDDTTNYGYILEIEKMCETEEEAKLYEELIKLKFRALGIEITPKEVMNEMFYNYLKEGYTYFD